MTTTTIDETERNRAAAQEMYGAAKAGDLQTFFSFISPQVVIEEPDFLPYGGTYEGIVGLQTLFATLASKIDLSSLDFERIVADGDCVCVIGRVPLANSDGVLQFIERVRMRDGKVVHLRIYLHDAANLLEGA